MDHRYRQLAHWLDQELRKDVAEITPLAGDASFRRYFRVHMRDGSKRVAMDAPPEREDCRPFLTLARRWHAAGIHVPRVLATDPRRGFLLLEDLGDRLYLRALHNGESPERLYRRALKALLAIQQVPAGLEHPLPPYDEALLDREMTLFRDWLVEGELGLSLNSQEHALLETTFSLLREAALAQPLVTVHRDYHSRNLLVTATRSPGIIDFQDAVTGPITYDAVSLLKDCYIRWPVERRERWMLEFHQASRAAGLHQADADTFHQWFELMGMQRHLKAAGIFARLHRRDGKAAYLADIPRTLDYLHEAAGAQPALRSFRAWLEDRVMPQLHRLEGIS